MTQEELLKFRAEAEANRLERENKLILFKQAELMRIPSLTNRQVLDQYIDLLPGDDYDGGFSDRGDITVEILESEFEKRLAESNFLTLR